MTNELDIYVLYMHIQDLVGTQRMIVSTMNFLASAFLLLSIDYPENGKPLRKEVEHIRRGFHNKKIQTLSHRNSLYVFNFRYVDRDTNDIIQDKTITAECKRQK